MYFYWYKRKTINQSLIIVFITVLEAQCLPINNGFTVKLNPVLGKEEGMKTFGTLFARTHENRRLHDGREIFSEDVVPHLVDMATGCNNQIARILFPLQASYNEPHNTTFRNLVNFINVPVMKHDVSDYKILVVSAPHNVKLLKGEAEPLIIYIVFPVDDISDTNTVNIPSIYFVNKSDGYLDLSKKDKVDPILIIDSNRTVTGLKSKEISKFIKFRSKLSNRLNIDTNF